MATLTCYGGVGEIGGNKVLLGEGSSRVFFDFGLPFGRRSRFFEEFLNPRPPAGLLDPLRMGLLPPLQGIYREDLIPHPRAWERLCSSLPFRPLSLDGVLLSHAHLDHSGYISFLRPDIPIYATAMTALIAKAIQDSGPTDFEKETCYANRRELREGTLRTVGGAVQRPFVFLGEAAMAQEVQRFWCSLPGKRKALEPCSPGWDTGEIAGLSLRCFPVDHSIFGAAAFAVETESGWVAYSGDLRLHGLRAAATSRFVEEMAGLWPLALICEGTRAGEARRVTEEEVFENSLAAVRAATGLVVADFGPRNVERLLTFHRVARETGRRLVVLAKDAYLLGAMSLLPEEAAALPPLADLLVYRDLKSRPAAWEQEVYERHAGRVVDAHGVGGSPEDWILCLSFWDINELIDIEPRGGLYVYSSSEAKDEEQKMDWQRLRAWLDHFGLGLVGDPEAGEVGFHASGHASGPELLELVRAIRPRYLVPVHTQDAGYFRENLKGEGIQVLEPEEGVEIRLS